MKQHVMGLAVLILFGLVTDCATAGTITAPGGISDEDGAGADIIDGVGPSIVLDMNYSNLNAITGFSVFKEFTFVVAGSGGTVLHTFTQTVSNNTQDNPPANAIALYTLELGFNSPRGFVRSSPGDGLSFVSASYPGFSSTAISLDLVVFTGGSHPPMTTVGGITFGVNIPDGLTSLTVRQVATAVPPVPEPGTLTLLGVGVIGFYMTRRRKRAAAA